MSVIGGIESLNKIYDDEAKKVERYFKLLIKDSNEFNSFESMELSFPTDYNRWLVVIGSFDMNRQKQILQSFVTTLKANIEIAEIKDGVPPPKACYDALRIYEIHLNMLSSEKRNTTDNTKTYDTDRNKISELFTFLKDNVIDCKYHEFITAVATADFSTITILKKSCFKYMIFALGTYGGMSKGWYSESVKSLDTKAGKCSGANVTDEYKTDLEVLLKQKKTPINILQKKP